jgi:hypothetical protein
MGDVQNAENGGTHMVFKDWMRVIGDMSMAAIFAAVLVLGGCGPQTSRRVASLPGDYHLVGGGLNISWKAPEPGTVFLVEKKTGKLIETRSLEEGEIYTFAVESVVRAEELQDMLGVNFSRTQFLLYFEPAGEKLAEPARMTE